MSFDRGPITYRVCTLPDTLPEDMLERFAANASPALSAIGEEPAWGWVSGRHLLETRIDEETVRIGNFFHLCLREAERKIPASLLNAECRMTELNRMVENGGQRLNRKEKKAIKDEIRERLLPNMPPQLTGTYVVIDKAEKKLYVSATSQRQLDLFLDFFRKALDVEPIPVTPESLATEILGTTPDDIPCLNISPDLPDGSDNNGGLGENFLTWLWFFQEERGGTLPTSQLGDFSLMIDGPLVMVADGGGALESAIRKGTPTISAEAKAALLVGKKLRQAKLILARGKGEEWSVTVNASDFVFRSLKLPEGETLDEASIFDERMLNLYIFNNVFRGLYQLFLKEMSDPEHAAAYQARAKEWVRNRRGQ